MSIPAIPKGATNVEAYRRTVLPFPSAREAFRAYLHSLDFSNDAVVLLPAFIGWSPNEGSGVFDPVSSLGLRSVFYRLDTQLQIDLNYLETVFRSRKVRVFVIIHYFGYVDPSAREAIRMARSFGAQVLEDEAHAMLTDLVDGGSGRSGDASIFSLHKILPVKSGGMLVMNSAREIEKPNGVGCDSHAIVLSYDLAGIAQQRKRNAERVHHLAQTLEPWLEPLWGLPGAQETPQSYPAIIKATSRDDIYFKMNSMNLGVTSLYHTMIPEITMEQFPESHRVSQQILNLPVHQDASSDDIDHMMTTLASVLKAV